MRYMALIMNLFYVLYVFLSLRESRRARRASADAAVGPSAVTGAPAPRRGSSFSAGSGPGSFVGRGSRVAAARRRGWWHGKCRCFTVGLIQVEHSGIEFVLKS